MKAKFAAPGRVPSRTWFDTQAGKMFKLASLGLIKICIKFTKFGSCLDSGKLEAHTTTSS